MDFMTGLPLLMNWKGNSYNLILIIINQSTTMLYYKSVKININASGLGEVIVDMVGQHHGLMHFIINDRGVIFSSKFWFSFCYFLGIKWRLSTTIHP